MLDPVVQPRGHYGLGVIGNAQPRRLQHAEVVGAVSHRQRGAEFYAALFRQLVQGGELRVPVQDRLPDLAGKLRAIVEQDIRAVYVETQFGRDSRREKGEAAGYQRGGGAEIAHGGDKHTGAGAELGRGPGALQRRKVQTFEHDNPFPQRGGEVQLAIHGTLGDLRDPLLEARIGGQLVQRFGCDDRAVHVRHQHRLAPATEFRDENICRLMRQHQLQLRRVRGFLDDEFGGLGWGKPVEMQAPAEIAGVFGIGLRERAGLPVGGQNDDIGHGVRLVGRDVVSGQASTAHGDDKVLAIVAGPTASGKSALALALARRLGGTVINADAMQCYRELRIITARPSLEDETLAPHRLYGVRPAVEPANAAWWREAALEELGRSKMPILCGGTGMYLSALLNGIADVPEPTEEARAEARRLLAEIGAPALHARLDAETALRLKPGDRQRIARAYEVLLSTGKGLAFWQQRPREKLTGWRCRMLLLDPPREALREAIATRFAAMLEAGAIEEVRRFLALGLDKDLPLMRAHGVPELGAYLRGEIGLEQATARAVLATHQYTKRQMTWFRHQKLADSPAMQIIQSRIGDITQLSESFIGDIINFITNPG